MSLALDVTPSSKHECSRKQAERLGRAVRIRTITLPFGPPESQPQYVEFRGFEEFLQKEFPRAATALRWEKPGPLSLLLTWPALERNPHGMLFYAHYDVVPASGDAGWTHPPFSGDIADGFVWGRGTLDDKSCLLAIMEAVESLLTEGFQPQGTVYIAFGGDEELGSSACAAASVARVLSERGIRLSCVLDEGSVIADGVPLLASRPIAMFGLAEKGSANLEIVVRGSTGHAAMPGKGTAAGALCRVVAAIERHRFPTRLTPTVARFFASLAPHAKGPRKTALRLLRLLWPVLRGPLSKNSTLDAFLRTTQAVTMLRAGEKENVVPDEARAVVNLRLLPGDTSAFALARIERVARKSIPNGFLLKVNFAEGGKPGEAIPESRLQGELWSALRDSLAQVAPDAVVAPCLVVASTDSRQFAGSADAIVRFLPIALTARDVARMHGVDERISLENYGRMIAFYENFVRRIAARQWPIRSGASCSVGMEGV